MTDEQMVQLAAAFKPAVQAAWRAGLRVRGILATVGTNQEFATFLVEKGIVSATELGALLTQAANIQANLAAIEADQHAMRILSPNTRTEEEL